MADQEQQTKRYRLAETKSEVVVTDNRLIFEDGRLYVSRTPYDGGRQSDFPEYIDVTEQVAQVIGQYLMGVKATSRPPLP